jgi:uncharacterized protein DUF6786
MSRTKLLFLSFLAAAGCTNPDRMTETKGGSNMAMTFDQIVAAVGKDDAIVLSGEGGSKVLVSPRYQGRIMTTKVGPIESVGFVSMKTIAEGETHPNFNNFGGQDRYWLGPEAGQYGIYFAPGADYDRKVWQVPPDFDKGPFKVEGKDAGKVKLSRDIAVMNYIGTRFKARAEREVGLIPAAGVSSALGVDLPAGVNYCGSYSENRLINAGDQPWKKETGLINIWVLGQFEPGDQTVIIAPFKPGDGPAYRDEPYFGKVKPDRLKQVGNAVLLRADGRSEGKVGIAQMRTGGLAGSMDYQKHLLVVVRFDVPKEPALYGNSSWVKNQPDPYSGDLFQTYNSDRSGSPDQRYAFYEMESVSPSVELAPGKGVVHRHETYCFQGDDAKLEELARKILGVDLAEVKKAMF